jgi:hypothetical protein
VIPNIRQSQLWLSNNGSTCYIQWVFFLDRNWIESGVGIVAFWNLRSLNYFFCPVVMFRGSWIMDSRLWRLTQSQNEILYFDLCSDIVAL